MMKKMVLIIGALGVLLGGLRLLQGLGVVHVKPILCFADCAPVQAASAEWAIAGFLLVLAGIVAILWSVRRRAKSSGVNRKEGMK